MLIKFHFLPFILTLPLDEKRRSSNEEYQKWLLIQALSCLMSVTLLVGFQGTEVPVWFSVAIACMMWFWVWTMIGGIVLIWLIFFCIPFKWVIDVEKISKDGLSNWIHGNMEE